jgi:beta-lactamase class A
MRSSPQNPFSRHWALPPVLAALLAGCTPAGPAADGTDSPPPPLPILGEGEPKRSLERSPLSQDWERGARGVRAGLSRGARGTRAGPQFASGIGTTARASIAPPLSGPLVPTSGLPPLPTRFESSGPIAGPLRAIAGEARRKGRAKAVGIAVIDLGRGRAYGVNAHRAFPPASVIKLSVMVAAFDAARRMPPGDFDRLRPDIRRMIVTSDNPATRRLVLRLGKRQVNRTMKALGLPGLSLAERDTGRQVLVGSRATAAETALLLARLARREVVSRRASEEMLAILGEQERRNRIPAGTLAAHRRKGRDADDGIWIGNKTGTLSGLVHDAGLVLLPRDEADGPLPLAYALAIYIQGTPSEAAGVQLGATIAARVYDLLSAPPAASAR